jgi:nucleoid-associated protein YgaU
MLLTETPVASPAPRTSVASASAAPAAPSTPAAPAAPVAQSTPPANDSFANFTPDPKISSEPLNSGASSSSAAPATQASASSAGQRTHRIAQGETFASISTAAYGSSRYYPAIIKANPGVDPNHLKVGMTITLPDIGTPGVRPTTPSADEAVHASAHVASAAPGIDATKQYRVQAGDSLYKISVKLYGKSDRADKIFQLNKQLMSDDPHKLKVGQVLQLPEPPTNTTAASR